MQIVRRRATKEILKQILYIDNSYYTFDTNINWYIERGYNRPYILLYDQEKIVGYCLIYPIKKELYQAITAGVLINDIDINPEMYLSKSKYYYCASCVLLPEYRGYGWGSKLLQAAIEPLKGKVCAIGVSAGGKKILSLYLKEIRAIPHNYIIYGGKIKKKRG